ncbi:hypothetical protein CGCSCA5_v012534 [Colletotrichum siamense]|nr:hypothetical protein CGCSCA5_v012534 [Colletotrichum siamense]
MTKQYISESTTYYDYFIFGMGPIGVITTIVSTIRLCGPASLRAFIGRSQEGNSAIEAELCTSTSRDVCEVFNNGGITRVLGRPKLLELIRTPKDYLSNCGYDTGVRTQFHEKVGFYSFRRFLLETRWGSNVRNPEWRLYPDQEILPASQNPPNLSLNVGIVQPHPWVFCLVAFVGAVLQAGVLVIAGVGVWVLGWNLNENNTASTNYAPTLFIIGTILMCGGMCASIAIIGQATTELRCRRAPSVAGSPETTIIMLQPRQVIADQSFDAYALFEDDEKRRSVWTSSIKTWDLDPGREIKFKSATCVAVLAVFVGYTLQFIGLRGMRAWVSIAQLITTVVMSILRGMLRMQRLKKDDNELSKKAEIVPGHELDWLTIELSRRECCTDQGRLKKSHEEFGVSFSMYCRCIFDELLRCYSKKRKLVPCRQSISPTMT